MAISFTTNQDKSNWFGSDVPFAEPAWYQGMDSPYYNDSHRAFRAKLRKFVDEWRPKIEDLDEQAMKGKPMPMELFRAAYDAGVYAPMIPAEFGGTPPEGGFDAFHDVIWLDEMSRLNCGGFGAGFTIWTMALPPVMIWGSEYLKNLLVRDVVTAKTFMALAISEPSAGSDVANIQTTAKKEGDHYVINGQKKWITFAKYADYFTVACRTGGDGMGGISLIVVPRNTPGVTVRPMPLQSLWSAGTSYVTFEDVKVPVKNLIGNKENQGFKMIMFNFNHERFSICVGACRAARECLAESIKYARVRTVFGKRLIDSQVIRHKIAEMATRVQALHAMIEHLAYQMKNNVHPIAIGGPMALLKVQASKTFEYCAREASQIFGGASYVREGKGALIERLYREVRSTAIPGGSEEIMLDLAMRMAKL